MSLSLLFLTFGQKQGNNKGGLDVSVPAFDQRSKKAGKQQDCPVIKSEKVGILRKVVPSGCKNAIYITGAKKGNKICW